MEELIKQCEQNNRSERLQRLKSLGVFIKTYNMSHLLVTRYSVKENFGIDEALKKVENAEKDLKKATEDFQKNQIALRKAEKEDGKKGDESSENKKIKELIKKDQEEIGQKKDAYKNEIHQLKVSVGTEMLNRLMMGFVSGGKPEEKEKEENTAFFFKKLNF